MAAAAAVQAIMPHQLLGRNKEKEESAKSSTPPPRNEEQEEKERQFVAQFSERKEPLPPSEIAQDPTNKLLGGFSSQLRLDDFELLKTLGTGIHTQE